MNNPNKNSFDTLCMHCVSFLCVYVWPSSMINHTQLFSPINTNKEGILPNCWQLRLAENDHRTKLCKIEINCQEKTTAILKLLPSVTQGKPMAYYQGGVSDIQKVWYADVALLSLLLARACGVPAVVVRVVDCWQWRSGHYSHQSFLFSSVFSGLRCYLFS